MKKKLTERSQISDSYKWDVEHLFDSDESWERERKRIQSALPKLMAFKGQFKQSDDTILKCLRKTFALQKRLRRLASYAYRKHDEDTRVAAYQGMRALSEKLAVAFGESTSFIEPELVALPRKRLAALKGKRGFADYDRYLHTVARLKPHIRLPNEEALLASASLMRDSGHNAYATFCGADLSFPEIKDEKGRTVKLSQASFSQFRRSPNRKVRKQAFEAFFGTFATYRNTLAAMLDSQVNANLVFSKARRYDSAIEAALDAEEIPVGVYTTMIKSVNRHLPLLHRYLDYRRSALKLKSLAYHDLYAPIVPTTKLRYTYPKACSMLVESVAPLGQDYCDVLAGGLEPESGWIDLMPNAGKRSGAYMDGGAYDVHPYVLCNYMGDYNSVSTLAHEMGHALHSHYSNKHQPYSKADYSIFVAEVASTLNETLLVSHLLRREKRPERQQFLLAEQLEGFRGTIFRQAMFSEFELAVYQHVERGEPLTADWLSACYLELARRYYGHPDVVYVDERYAVEWAYIPHFYYNFYVFQYVTGMTAAVALAEQLRQDEKGARSRYFANLLQAGGSDAPVELLARAGVDLTSKAPYDLAAAAFKRTLDALQGV